MNRITSISLSMMAAVLLCTCLGATAERQVLSLDGEWQIAEGSLDAMPAEFTHTIQVPGLADLAQPAFEKVGGVPERPRWPDEQPKDPLREAFWYRRTFTLDGAVPDVAQLLFHKAKFGTKVFLNGKVVGEYLPCFTPFSFDVAKYLKGKGQTNELVVRIGAAPEALPLSVLYGFDPEKRRYFPGIYDSVDLILSGTPHIVNVQAVPQIGQEKLLAVVEVINAKDEPADVDLQFTVRASESGRQAGAASQTVKGISPGETRKVRVEIPIADCQLWSPENPFLYTLQVATATDNYSTRFGMRSFSFDPETGFARLNEHPYFLRGSNICIFRFFEDPERGDKPWDEQWVRKLFRRIKSMHWNSVRFTIGPMPDFWYDIADETGILIQDEFAIWFYTVEKWPEEVDADHLSNQFRTWMRHRWNHPSVVIWDAQNESQNAEVTSETIRRVRDLDLSNRPWDNGYGRPQAPGDTSESHPYRAKRANFTRGIFAEESGIPDNGPHHGAGKPYIINEYGWLWLNRDGSPTKLTGHVYERLLGEDATVEERRRYYARMLAAMTEFWRGMRQCAGVLHFCTLTYSKANGFTSDNWIDLDNLVFEPHFKEHVRDAFAPVGLMLNFWPEQIFNAGEREIEVFVLNDLGETWKAPVKLSLLQGADVLWTESQQVEVEPYGRGKPAFTVDMPDDEGEYELVAEIKGVDGETVSSRREFEVVDRQTVGLAYGQPVEASSSQNERKYPAAAAVDGNPSTRWSSEFVSDAWLKADLGSIKTVSRVELLWENAHAKAYTIQVSKDGKKWQDVYSTDKCKGGREEIEFEPVPARYVRIQFSERATKFGYSLWELKVF